MCIPTTFWCHVESGYSIQPRPQNRHELMTTAIRVLIEHAQIVLQVEVLVAVMKAVEGINSINNALGVDADAEQEMDTAPQ